MRKRESSHSRTLPVWTCCPIQKTILLLLLLFLFVSNTPDTRRALKESRISYNKTINTTPSLCFWTFSEFNDLKKKKKKKIKWDRLTFHPFGAVLFPSPHDEDCCSCSCWWHNLFSNKLLRASFVLFVSLLLSAKKTFRRDLSTCQQTIRVLLLILLISSSRFRLHRHHSITEESTPHHT